MEYTTWDNTFDIFQQSIIHLILLSQEIRTIFYSIIAKQTGMTWQFLTRLNQFIWTLKKQKGRTFVQVEKRNVQGTMGIQILD